MDKTYTGIMGKDNGEKRLISFWVLRFESLSTPQIRQEN
jgi:hypothetical protein